MGKEVAKKKEKKGPSVVRETPFGIAVGLKKGFVVTKRKRPVIPQRKHKKVNAVRDLIQEVCGYAPYERRIMELLKVGLDKRALRLAKRRLGTHQRAKKKREHLTNVLQKQRIAAQKREQEEKKKKEAAAKKH